jgi:hypothetical protein
MKKKVLITGGAGFIGSHVADELLQHGYQVRALDVLSPQVHGEQRSRPEYLDPDVELIQGDVRDFAVVERALAGIDIVYHFAAAVGVGQSMYQITNYTSMNNGGTAVLLEALVRNPDCDNAPAGESRPGQAIWGARMHPDERPLGNNRARQASYRRPILRRCRGGYRSPVAARSFSGNNR